MAGRWLALLVAVIGWLPWAARAQARVTVLVNMATAEVSAGRAFSRVVSIVPYRGASADAAVLGEMVKSALQPANFPTVGVQDPAFLLTEGGGWEWLRARLERAGLDAAVVVKLDANGLGRILVTSAVTQRPAKAIRLVIYSWALADGQTPVIFAPAAADLPDDIKRAAAQNPVPLAELWAHSSIELRPGQSPRPATGTRDTVPQLRTGSIRVLLSACTAYSADPTQGTGLAKMTAAMRVPIQGLLGASDAYLPPEPAADGDTLVVTLPKLDPILGLGVRAPAIELPAKVGGLMDLKKFDQAYGAMKFGRELTKKKDAFLRKLQGTLDASDAEAATRFPTFIATEAREALTATLRKNDEASDASAEVDHTTGKLMFEVVYRPVQASYTAKIEGDSARGIGGTAGWSKTWARGRAAAADLTLGQNSQSASASFTHEPQALTKALTWQLDYEGTYTRDHDIRIGTQTGPLVTRRDTLIGPRAKLTYLKAQDQRIAADTTKWQRHWYYSTTLLAGYRSLAGAGPPAFLASPPAHFGGAVFTNVHAFEYTDGPVPPPPAVAEAHRRVGFSAGLNLELTEFAPGGSGAYFRGRLDAFAHQAFGTSAHSDYYVEARSSYGAMTGAAPRVDFWRLGGQDVLGGMEDGELAGRFLLAAALEGGWSVTTLISRWNPAASGGAADPGGSSLLDGLYVVGLAEYGRVGDQARAGADFSRHTKATSLGAGVRLFGALPGPASDSSIFIGYAWSPESIHRSGRIFARVLIHFGN